MLFQAVLFTVIAYLVACYAYGMYLLWKLYTGRKFQAQNVEGEPLEAPAQPPAVSASESSSDVGYESPAKAA